MPPYVTTAFGRKAYGNMPGRRGQSRGTGGGGRAPKNAPVSLDMVLGRLWGSMLSPQQQRKEARQQANLAFNEAMRGLRLDYQREYEQMRREQTAYQNVAQVLGQFAGSDAAAIRAAYDAAAGNIGAINTGLIGSVQGAQQQEINAAQQSAEAAAGFQGDVGVGTPAQNAIPSTHLGVTLPVGEIGAIGSAAYEQALAKAKGYAGQMGYQANTDIAAQIQQLRDEYLMQRQDLRLKRPSLFQEALQGSREAGRSDLATLINALTLQNTALGDLRDYQVDLTESQRKTAEAIAKAKTTAQKDRIARLAAQGISADGKTPLPGFYRHPSGRILKAGQYIAADGSVQNVPSGYKVGKGGKLTPAPYPQSGGTGPGGASTSDLISIEQGFKDDARKLVTDTINVDADRGRPRRQPPSKEALVRMIMSQYGGTLIGRYGLTQKKLRAWALQVVNSFPAKYWNPKTYSGATSSGSSGSSGGGGLGTYETP